MADTFDDTIYIEASGLYGEEVSATFAYETDYDVYGKCLCWLELHSLNMDHGELLRSDVIKIIGKEELGRQEDLVADRFWDDHGEAA